MKSNLTQPIKNWPEYNRSLVSRGNLTIWIDGNLEDTWYAPPDKNLKKGRRCLYSASCIEIALTLRSLFHFPLRATQGFLEGLLNMLQFQLKVPCYSQLSRRAGGLKIQYFSKESSQIPRDLVVDSTGLKIYGEGEWKMRTHGKQKRRTWRKLHLAVDPKRMQVVSMELTLAEVHDDSVMPILMKDQKNVEHVYADGAYISKNCFDSIAKTGGKAVIPIRSGTGLVQKNPSPGQIRRNEIVREIWAAGGRKAWKKKSDYHRRSLVETQMYRFKTILGPKLSNRTLKNQIAEAKIKVFILNQMTQLGMPLYQCP